MGVHSNYRAAGERLDDRQRLADRFIAVEAVAAEAGRPVDEAQEGLAESEPPGPHGPHVAVARRGRAVRVRVQETGDVAVRLLALQDPEPVEVDAGPFAPYSPPASAAPDAAAALAEQDPALLDAGRQRRGWTRQ